MITTDSSNKAFFTAVLHGIGAPVTQANLDALAGVAHMEGANNRYNPLNSVVPSGNSTSFNSVGVQDYKSFDNGVAGTIALLHGSRWNGVVGALRAGNSQVAVAQQFANIYQSWDPGVTAATFMGGGSSTLAASAGSAGGSSGGAVPNLTGAAPGGNPKMAKADYTSALGSLSGLLTSVPELKKLLDQAIATNQPINDFVNSVQNSHYYKTNADSVRSYAALQVSDPAEARQQQNNFTRQVNDAAAQLGIRLTTAQLNSIISQGLWHGLTGDTSWLTQQIVKVANFSGLKSTAGLQGQVAGTVQQLQTLANNYGWTWTPAQLGTAALAILGGKTTIDTYKMQLVTAAKSLFPALSDQLDHGLTVMDAAQPYMQSMSNLLELDPSKVDLNTPLVRKALMGTSPTAATATPASAGTTSTKTTTPVLTPLWQFENQVRQDPRWGFTDNSHAAMATQTMQLGRDFGFET